jgi:hypothetical protein
MPDKSYVQGPPVVNKYMTYLALGGPFGASVGGIHAVSTHKGHLKWSYTNASCTATNPALGAGERMVSLQSLCQGQTVRDCSSLMKFTNRDHLYICRYI